MQTFSQQTRGKRRFLENQLVHKVKQFEPINFWEPNNEFIIMRNRTTTRWPIQRTPTPPPTQDHSFLRNFHPLYIATSVDKECAKRCGQSPWHARLAFIPCIWLKRGGGTIRTLVNSVSLPITYPCCARCIRLTKKYNTNTTLITCLYGHTHHCIILISIHFSRELFQHHTHSFWHEF